MTWSYDESESADRDRLRGIIGDTNTNDQLLQNETLDAILTTHSSVLSAAKEGVRRIIAKLARDVDSRSAAGMTASRGAVIQHYRDLMEEISSELSTEAECFVGGVSVSENDSLEAESDFEQPSFKIGDNDNTHARYDRENYDR